MPSLWPKRWLGRHRHRRPAQIIEQLAPLLHRSDSATAKSFARSAAAVVLRAAVGGHQHAVTDQQARMHDRLRVDVLARLAELLRACLCNA